MTKLNKRILILLGHPDSPHPHLCHALADSYAEAAEAAGHELRRIDLALLNIPMLRGQEQFQHDRPPQQIEQAQAAIRWADHVVLFFPLWLGTMPALVKAFCEQVFRPGFAYAQAQQGFPQKLLSGRSARLVVTMGMPAWLYRWVYCAHGLRGLGRNILGFVGFAPVRYSLFGMVNTASDKRRQAWLREMAKLGARGD